MGAGRIEGKGYIRQTGGGKEPTGAQGVTRGSSGIGKVFLLLVERTMEP